MSWPYFGHHGRLGYRASSPSTSAYLSRSPTGLQAPLISTIQIHHSRIERRGIEQPPRRLVLVENHPSPPPPRSHLIPATAAVAVVSGLTSMPLPHITYCKGTHTRNQKQTNETLVVDLVTAADPVNAVIPSRLFIPNRQFLRLQIRHCSSYSLCPSPPDPGPPTPSLSRIQGTQSLPRPINPRHPVFLWLLEVPLPAPKGQTRPGQASPALFFSGSRPPPALSAPASAPQLAPSSSVVARQRETSDAHRASLSLSLPPPSSHRAEQQPVPPSPTSMPATFDLRHLHPNHNSAPVLHPSPSLTVSTSLPNEIVIAAPPTFLRCATSIAVALYPDPRSTHVGDTSFGHLRILYYLLHTSASRSLYTTTMAGLFRKVYDWLLRTFWATEMDVTMIGLQNAGKTSLLRVLAGGEFTIDSIPTVGFNMKRVQRGHVTLKCWDIGGQPRFRTMWERYCRGVNAIVFIVDIADMDLLQQAREELHALMDQASLREIPLLVLGNKSDLPQKLSVDELIDALDLKSIGHREVCCYGISAKEETNLDAVLQWLMKWANSCPALPFLLDRIPSGLAG
ncbi:ADP-ribosylation factor family protein [Colletotrichum lupini]|uniref:ADP-ribosylation factor family protein n=1 Tax=Colletotrichum lupini TaxID=145971 RepID=A0A9Q8SPG3_9PEZI|nr:ADP-ribosylation factor family protein [Colletotrichum lupini]UQC80665.1 ADP-ribosylation factor family protein [Colletotrichum lupini]